MSKFEQFFRRQSMQSILAFLGITFLSLYLLLVTFYKIPSENKEFALIALGYLIGTGNTIYNFFFGNSKKQTPGTEPESKE